MWNEIKKFVSWEKLKLSLMGRIAVIKMNILPKMFLFQTIPIVCGIPFKQWQRHFKIYLAREENKSKKKILQDVKE